jgi:uncharacterized cupin superfamily protein
MCPIVNAHNCQAPHTMYTISGRKKVVMDDGTEDETRPGDSAGNSARTQCMGD